MIQNNQPDINEVVRTALENAGFKYLSETDDALYYEWDDGNGFNQYEIQLNCIY